VHYFSGQARRADEFRFLRHGETFSVPISGTAAVNETGLYIKMCLAGFGLAQLAENIVADHLREGAGGSADGLAAAGTRHIALSAPALSLSRRAGVC
jgi:hypothetical protein